MASLCKTQILLKNKEAKSDTAEGSFFFFIFLFFFCLPELKDCLPCAGNCSSFARLASVHWFLCALQMCCNVRRAFRVFALNVLSLVEERNFQIELRTMLGLAEVGETEFCPPG